MIMEKIKRSALKEMLFTELASNLATMNFVRQEQRFARTHTKELAQSLHINCAETPDCTNVTVHLGIRHEAIESIALGWNQALSKKVRNSSATWGVELGQYVDREILWTINEHSNLQKLVCSMMDSIKSYALPVFGKRSSLEEILSDFSSESFRQWHQTLGGRALRMPLVLAYLGRESMAVKAFEEQYALLAKKQDLLHSDYPIFVAYACGKLNLSNPLKLKED